MVEKRSLDQIMARLTKLERDNRRLRWTIGIIGLLALTATTAAATRSRAPAVVTAREFQLVDSSGTSVGRSTSEDGGQFTLISPSGALASLTPRLLTIDGTALHDPAKGLGFTMQFVHDTTAVGLRVGGPGGELQFASLDAGPLLKIVDRNGTPRVEAGVTQLTRTQTGSTEITSPASLLLFDTAGHVLWRAPRERK